MLKRIFALTDTGVKNVRHGILLMTLHNLSIMLPTVLLLLVTRDMILHFFDPAKPGPSLGFYWALALLLLLLIYWIYRYTYRSTYVAAYEESANTRVSLAEKIRKLPLSYFGEKNLSDLTSTLMDDTTTVEHTLSNDVAELFGGIFSCLVILLTLFLFDWRLALALTISLPVSLLILIIGKWASMPSNWRNRRAKLAISEKVQEYLENIKLIQSSPQKDGCRRSVETTIKQAVRTSIIYEVVMGIFINGAYSILRVGLGIIILTGSSLLLQNKISFVTFLLFLFIAARIYDPLTNLFFKMGEFFYSFVSAARIREIEEYPSQQGSGDIALQSFTIVFEDVSFAYREQKVLEGVSFTAKQGEITALVGPSGCGKSTIGKLTARFWDVKEGRLLIGGHDIREIDPETLLSYISIVFQDVVLFNDTIYNNIKIGKNGATEEEIKSAAQLARCEDFIAKLPEGYDTVIGENGKTLSGGERQRLSIARAFLKDAPIILLDEATASLDPENETLIQEAIGKLIENKTVLIIAHRLRSVENCDKIVVLKAGKIQESGGHERLMANDGLYRHLYELQRESAQWGVGGRKNA